MKTPTQKVTVEVTSYEGLTEAGFGTGVGREADRELYAKLVRKTSSRC